MKMRKDNKFIVFGMATVVILAIAAITTIPKEKEYNYEEMTKEEIGVAIEEQVNNIEINELASLGERDRMEKYVSKFISEVEYEDYERAYEMLYDGFKDNYFPTYTSFEDYAKSKFPRTCSLEYTNFERNGDVYVLWVTMRSATGSRDSGIEMNFVIKENALNDFEMSFSVI